MSEDICGGRYSVGFWLRNSVEIINQTKRSSGILSIHDLFRQISHLHGEQVDQYGRKPFLVYRGQGLSTSDFEKLRKSHGGLRCPSIVFFRPVEKRNWRWFLPSKPQWTKLGLVSFSFYYEHQSEYSAYSLRQYSESERLRRRGRRTLFDAYSVSNSDNQTDGQGKTSFWGVIDLDHPRWHAIVHSNGANGGRCSNF